MQRKLLYRIGGVPVYLDSGKNVIFFSSNMTMDDDGDPFCYGPAGKGRDWLANAGHPGRWWAVVTDVKGKPIIQKPGDPAPGYYVSTTSLQDPKKKLTDPARYVNAWLTPYVSLSPQLFDHVKLGDLGTAIYKERICHFLIADSGNKGHIGEGSPALAEYLGIDKDPKKGGVDEKSIGYILYPSSGTGMPLNGTEIQTRAKMVIDSRGIFPSRYFVMDKGLRQQKMTRKVIVRR
jgi:hypothetical protein